MPEGAVVAVTVEPEGGVDQPTTDPFVVAERDRQRAGLAPGQPGGPAGSRSYNLAFVLFRRRSPGAAEATAAHSQAQAFPAPLRPRSLRPCRTLLRVRDGIAARSRDRPVEPGPEGDESTATSTRPTAGCSPSCGVTRPRHRRLRADLADDEAGDRRRRGPPLLGAPGRRPARHRPGVWADIRHKEVIQGGSTITQQFVKNTYSKPERTVSRKLKEAALAWQLEQRWSKERILTAYLNTIYFGNGAYGVEMAARVYFDKRAEGADAPRGRAAGRHSGGPDAHTTRSQPETRARAGATRSAADVRAGPITQPTPPRRRGAAPGPETSSSGNQGPAPYFAEYVKQQLDRQYGSARSSAAASRSTRRSTSSSRGIAREAVAKWLPDPNGPEAALVAIDPRDGQVLAMIGGDNFRKSQFNLAVQGQRQTGSAFKPFVLDDRGRGGHLAATTFASKPTMINLGDKLWSVHNYEGAYLGPIDLQTATIYSDNIGLRPADAARRAEERRQHGAPLGDHPPARRLFAIGLGAEAVSPLEMARAFASLANGGSRIDGSVLGNVPRAVRRSGRQRADSNDSPSRSKVLDPNDAAIVNSILQRVVDRGHRQARRPRRPAGRRQDGDDRELRRRLVRRLHAAARSRGLGRLPGPAAADGDRVRGRALSPAARSRP